MQKYFNNVQRVSGAAVQGASVAVTVTSTGATATIYSDDGITTQTNPMTTDVNGFFSFFAADNVYTLTISGNGITTYSLPSVTLQTLFTEVLVNWNPIISGDTTTIKTCTAISRSGTTLTFDIASHGFAVDDGFAIAGTATASTTTPLPGWDFGYKVVTVPDANHVTATIAQADITAFPTTSFSGSATAIVGYQANATGFWHFRNNVVTFNSRIACVGGTINALISGNALIFGLPRMSSAVAVSVIPLGLEVGVDLPAGAVSQFGRTSQLVATNTPACISIFCNRDNAAAIGIATGAGGVTSSTVLVVGGSYRAS
jgi:hypothetical protein